MTSSADPRRPAAPAGARKRVAGARRRTPSTNGPSSTLVLDRPTTSIEAVDEPVVDALAVDHDPDDSARTSTSSASSASSAPSATSEEEKAPRTSAGLWVSAIAATLALAALVGSLVYALRPSVGDGDRTAAVGSARTTLESLLSYSGASFDKHVGEVTPQLTSPFKEQFTKIAATDIKPMAVKNDATVQAKVYDAGVMDATGDGGEGTTVRVMAFVNQATTTKAQQAPAIDQNRVIATMRKVGDRWLVSQLSAY